MYKQWLLAVIITLCAVLYQRMTGPTYTKKIKLNINENSYTLKFPRSHSREKNCEIKLNISDQSITGNIFYRRFPTSGPWKSTEFIRQGNGLIAKLPHQPPAGKLQYFIRLINEKSTQHECIWIAEKTPVIIRFKGDVPAYFLIPHIIFMFAAMLISNLAGLLAIKKIVKYKFYARIVFILLLTGGFIFGPIVQKYAFGHAWTGFPFGWDLTDNRALIGLMGWLVAVIWNWKKQRPYLIIIAAVILLLAYSVPHSLFGSELDYSTGKVTTGFVINYFF